MSRAVRPTATIAAIWLMLAALGGCADTGDNGSADPGDTPVTSVSPAETTDPSFEPTDPESPQPTQDKPSLELANAPIGGDVDADGAYQCAEVNWLGRNPIPAGTAIRTRSVGLDPGGIFKLDQDGCRPDDRPCVNVTWQEESFKPCYVGVRQVAGGTEDDPVRLVMAATAVCATEKDCANLVGDQPGSQITFVPAELEGPSESPPDSPPETPIDSPPDTPVETPAETPAESPTDG